MKYKKFILKILPYFASIVVGFLFYFIGSSHGERIKGLFINISAAFFAIPLIYLFFQLTHTFSQKKLNKEIFDYVKMQIDREVLSIINQLYKIVYSLREANFSLPNINKFLSLNGNEIKDIISNNEYLGFQLFKEWGVGENKVQELLKNSFVFKILENEQIISMISIIKAMRYLESIQKNDDLYLKTDNKDISYKVASGKEISEENIKYPDRYLLLKDLGSNKFLVADFGDFSKFNRNRLLYIFAVNEKYLESYSSAIYDLISEINKWIELTGTEFIIDNKAFRLGYRLEKNEMDSVK